MTRRSVSASLDGMAADPVTTTGADALWAAIDDQRTRTADLLESLRPDEWETSSLCVGWTVRDVAAHLTLQALGLRDILPMVVRYPGRGMNEVIRESSRRRGAWPTGRIVAAIRSGVGSRRHNLGVTPQETLIDIVVHGQDIAVPLGRTLAVDPGVAGLAAGRVWSYAASRAGRRMATVFHRLPEAGHRLVATDLDWQRGEASGPELRGPILGILLVLTGRPAGLELLTPSERRGARPGPSGPPPA